MVTLAAALSSADLVVLFLLSALFGACFLARLFSGLVLVICRVAYAVWSAAAHRG